MSDSGISPVYQNLINFSGYRLLFLLEKNLKFNPFTKINFFINQIGVYFNSTFSLL